MTAFLEDVLDMISVFLVTEEFNSPSESFSDDSSWIVSMDWSNGWSCI